jgi:Na+/proline symporter
VITLTGMMMALGSKNIYELVGESSILGLVSMLIPMTAAIFWQRANALGAISSMILGFIFWLFAEHIFSTSIPALFYGMVGGLIGLFAGNFGSKSINKKIEGEH